VSRGGRPLNVKRRGCARCLGRLLSFAAAIRSASTSDTRGAEFFTPAVLVRHSQPGQIVHFRQPAGRQRVTKRRLPVLKTSLRAGTDLVAGGRDYCDPLRQERQILATRTAAFVGAPGNPPVSARSPSCARPELHPRRPRSSRVAFNQLRLAGHVTSSSPQRRHMFLTQSPAAVHP